MKKTRISDEEKAFLQMSFETDKLPEDRELEEYMAALDEAVDELGNIDEVIKEALESANLGQRGDTEELYLTKIDLLYYLARGFNPLSEYGRDVLGEAKKTRLEFEQLVAPLASRITKRNMDIFAPLMTEELKEEILLGKTDAIGAIRGGSKGSYGAGVIVYNIEADPVEADGCIVRIKWLYVAETFRQKRIAHFLIGTLLSQSAGLKVSGVTVDIPALNDYAEVAAYIFDRWGFVFATGTTPEFMADVEDIEGVDEIAEMAEGVKSLAGSGGDPAVIIAKYIRKNDRAGMLKSSLVSVDHYNKELCFYTGEWNRAKAMLLTRITASGVLSVELLDAVDDDEEEIKKLVSAFLMKAMGESGGEARVSVPVEFPGLGEFLDSVCPESTGAYLIEGILTA